MKMKLAAAALAVSVAVATSGCAFGGSDGPEANSGQFSASSTTDAAGQTTVSTTAVDLQEPEEFAEAEAEHDEDHASEEPAWGSGAVGDVNFGDPLEVASVWGCALRAKPAGEDSDAWLLRLAGPMSPRGLAKLSSLSSPADSTTQRSAFIGAHLLEEGDGTRTWRVDCQSETLDADGKRIAYDSTTPVTVVMVKAGGRWVVDDFAWGGIELGTL